MSTDSELREAAERLRKHHAADPWWNSPYGIHDQSNWMIDGVAKERDVRLLVTWACEHLAQRADDGELVTEAKLNALGYEDQDYCRGSKAFALPFGVYVYGKATSGPKCWDYYLFCGGEKVKDDPTMRDVRNLLSALGLNQEGGQR